jgi:hypothetical protein
MSAIDVSTPRVRPSGWWFVLVPIIILVGVGFSIHNGIDEFGHLGDRFTKLGSDRQATIELREGEHASVWSISENGRAADTLRTDVAINVVDPDGEHVDFDKSFGTTTFDIGSSTGIKLGDFEATTPGTYAIGALLTTDDPSFDAAVGNLDVGSAVLRTITPAIVGTLAAIALLVLLLVLRGRSKRRIAGGWQQPSLQAPVTTATSTSVGSSEPPTPQGPISFE